jgi:uncharacterized membrane protein YphA (DoxX/SURF4 family)
MRGDRKHRRAAGPRRDEPALYPWRLGQIACARGDAGDARQPSSTDGEYGWMLAFVVELGGGLAILFGLFTRPVGLVLAIWCVATALIAAVLASFERRSGLLMARNPRRDPLEEAYGAPAAIACRARSIT